jgi:hypothetical protein
LYDNVNDRYLSSKRWRLAAGEKRKTLDNVQRGQIIVLISINIIEYGDIIFLFFFLFFVYCDNILIQRISQKTMEKLLNVQGHARSALGIGIEESLRCTVYGIIVLLAIILIWVGCSLIVSHVFVDTNTKRVAYGHGGIVLLVGLTIVGAVHAAREGYLPSPI